MKIEIKEGKISIDAYEFIDTFTSEEKLKLVECLACQDEIVKHVADQIIYGWTGNSWHASRGFSGTPFTELDKAIRFVAEHSGELASREIKRLESLVKLKDKTISENWTKIRELEDRLYDRAGLST